MSITDLPRDRTGAPSRRFAEKSHRARLSGPALRAFRSIADAWGFSEAERIAALGHPGRSTYHAWMKKAADGAPVTLSVDTLTRLSAMLGIHRGLQDLFAEPHRALEWLSSPHRGTVFAGASPRALIVDNGIDGMMTVRRYLDGWRAGHIDTATPASPANPVTESDLVFL